MMFIFLYLENYLDNSRYYSFRIHRLLFCFENRWNRFSR